MPSVLRYVASGFDSGGMVRVGNFIYIVKGGFFPKTRTLTVTRCNLDLTGCTDVYTGDKVADTYIGPVVDGKIYFSGLNHINGSLVGYFDTNTNTGTYIYTGDKEYRYMWVIIKYYYNGQFLIHHGPRDSSIVKTTNPLDPSTYQKILSGSDLIDTSSGSLYSGPFFSVIDDIEKVLINVLTNIINVFICDFDKNTFNISNCTKIFSPPSNYTASILSAFAHSTVCGGYIFSPIYRYDRATNMVYFELYRSPISPISFTKIAERGPLPRRGEITSYVVETHSHVFCLGNKYVLWGYCNSGIAGNVEILDLNGNTLYSVNMPYHIASIPYLYGNEVYIPGGNSQATGTVDFLKITLDEKSPFLNVTVSGRTINVSGAYPNRPVLLCKQRNTYGDLIHMPQGGQCISTTADANGNASFTVSTPDRYVVIAQ